VEVLVTKYMVVTLDAAGGAGVAQDVNDGTQLAEFPPIPAFSCSFNPPLPPVVAEAVAVDEESDDLETPAEEGLTPHSLPAVWRQVAAAVEPSVGANSGHSVSGGSTGCIDGSAPSQACGTDGGEDLEYEQANALVGQVET